MNYYRVTDRKQLELRQMDEIISADEYNAALNAEEEMLNRLGLLDDTALWLCREYYTDETPIFGSEIARTHYAALDYFVEKGCVEFIQFENGNYGLYREDDAHTLEFVRPIPPLNREAIAAVVNNRFCDMFVELELMYGIEGGAWDYYAEPSTIFNDISDQLIDAIYNAIDNMQ